MDAALPPVAPCCPYRRRHHRRSSCRIVCTTGDVRTVAAACFQASVSLSLARDASARTFCVCVMHVVPPAVERVMMHRRIASVRRLTMTGVLGRILMGWEMRSSSAARTTARGIFFPADDLRRHAVSRRQVKCHSSVVAAVSSETWLSRQRLTSASREEINGEKKKCGTRVPVSSIRSFPPGWQTRQEHASNRVGPGLAFGGGRCEQV